MLKKIKKILLENDNMLNVAAFLYNLMHVNIPIKGNFRGVFLRKTGFQLKGKNISIICSPQTRLENCKFNIEGDNCVITIGKKCILKNVELWIEDDNTEIKIGDFTTMEGGHIAATEGKRIDIGDNCMISNHVVIRNGDSHPIFDAKTNSCINKAQSIIVGNEVWLGSNVTVLKGAVIANKSIIGTGSIVTSKLTDENAIYVGIPAKKVREDVYWQRHRIVNND